MLPNIPIFDIKKISHGLV